MNALDKHFDRLAALLPAETVAELRAAYRRDAAADGAASRQRTKARQAAQRAAWAAWQREREATKGAEGGE